MWDSKLKPTLASLIGIAKLKEIFIIAILLNIPFRKLVVLIAPVELIIQFLQTKEEIAIHQFFFFITIFFFFTWSLKGLWHELFERRRRQWRLVNCQLLCHEIFDVDFRNDTYFYLNMIGGKTKKKHIFLKLLNIKF